MHNYNRVPVKDFHRVLMTNRTIIVSSGTSVVNRLLFATLLLTIPKSRRPVTRHGHGTERILMDNGDAIHFVPRAHLADTVRGMRIDVLVLNSELDPFDEAAIYPSLSPSATLHILTPGGI